jgi:hypothetical protein
VLLTNGWPEVPGTNDNEWNPHAVSTDTQCVMSSCVLCYRLGVNPGANDNEWNPPHNSY